MKRTYLFLSFLLFFVCQQICAVITVPDDYIVYDTGPLGDPAVAQSFDFNRRGVVRFIKTDNVSVEEVGTVGRNISEDQDLIDMGFPSGTDASYVRNQTRLWGILINQDNENKTGKFKLNAVDYTSLKRKNDPILTQYRWDYNKPEGAYSRPSDSIIIRMPADCDSIVIMGQGTNNSIYGLMAYQLNKGRDAHYYAGHNTGYFVARLGIRLEPVEGQDSVDIVVLAPHKDWYASPGNEEWTSRIIAGQTIYNGRTNDDDSPYYVKGERWGLYNKANILRIKVYGHIEKGEIPSFTDIISEWTFHYRPKETGTVDLNNVISTTSGWGSQTYGKYASDEGVVRSMLTASKSYNVGYDADLKTFGSRLTGLPVTSDTTDFSRGDQHPEYYQINCSSQGFQDMSLNFDFTIRNSEIEQSLVVVAKDWNTDSWMLLGRFANSANPVTTLAHANCTIPNILANRSDVEIRIMLDGGDYPEGSELIITNLSIGGSVADFSPELQTALDESIRTAIALKERPMFIAVQNELNAQLERTLSFSFNNVEAITSRLQAANAAAEASIAQYRIIAEAIARAQEVLSTADETEKGHETLLSATNHAIALMTEGRSLDPEKDARILHVAVNDFLFLEASATTPRNLTSFIVNPMFAEGVEGWIITNNYPDYVTVTTGTAGTLGFESTYLRAEDVVTTNGRGHFSGFSVEQTIENIQNGDYYLYADVYCEENGNLGLNYLYLYANEHSVRCASATVDGPATNKVKVRVSDNTLRIRLTSTMSRNNLIAIGNFRLEYVNFESWADVNYDEVSNTVVVNAGSAEAFNDALAASYPEGADITINVSKGDYSFGTGTHRMPSNRGTLTINGNGSTIDGALISSTGNMKMKEIVVDGFTFTGAIAETGAPFVTQGGDSIGSIVFRNNTFKEMGAPLVRMRSNSRVEALSFENNLIQDLLGNNHVFICNNGNQILMNFSLIENKIVNYGGKLFMQFANMKNPEDSTLNVNVKNNLFYNFKSADGSNAYSFIGGAKTAYLNININNNFFYYDSIPEGMAIPVSVNPGGTYKEGAYKLNMEGNVYNNWNGALMDSREVAYNMENDPAIVIEDYQYTYGKLILKTDTLYTAGVEKNYVGPQDIYYSFDVQSEDYFIVDNLAAMKQALTYENAGDNVVIEVKNNTDEAGYYDMGTSSNRLTAKKTLTVKAAAGNSPKINGALISSGNAKLDEILVEGLTFTGATAETAAPFCSQGGDSIGAMIFRNNTFKEMGAPLARLRSNSTVVALTYENNVIQDLLGNNHVFICNNGSQILKNFSLIENKIINYGGKQFMQFTNMKNPEDSTLNVNVKNNLFYNFKSADGSNAYSFIEGAKTTYLNININNNFFYLDNIPDNIYTPYPFWVYPTGTYSEGAYKLNMEGNVYNSWDGVLYDVLGVAYTIDDPAIVIENLEFVYGELIPHASPLYTAGLDGTYVGPKNLYEEGPDFYRLSFDIEGKEYAHFMIAAGTEISSYSDSVAAPFVDGRIFAGWEILPDIMPANDLTILGCYVSVPDNAKYFWTSPTGHPVELGGQAVANEAAAGRVNYAYAGYYTISLNGKKNWNADNQIVTITLDEEIVAGDTIVVTAFRIKDWDGKKASVYFEADTAMFDDGTDGLAYTNIYNKDGVDYDGDGETPSTITVVVPDGIAGNVLKLTRAQTGTNLFITSLSIIRGPGEPTYMVWNLSKGWNWVSVNAGNEDLYSTAMLLAPMYSIVERFVGFDEELIKDNVLGLVGGLGQAYPTEAYKLKVSNDFNHSWETPVLDPARVPVYLYQGWNWIGYVPSFSNDLSQALSNLLAEENDIIKSQEEFAVYSDGAWSGTLQTLNPGQGYMYYAAQTQRFHYSEAAPDTSNAAPRMVKKKAMNLNGAAPWSYDTHRYPDNVTLIAALIVGSMEVDYGRYTIGAFVGDECRGISKSVNGRLFMTVHGSVSDRQPVSFKVFDSVTGNEIPVTETLNFAGQHLGSMTDPYVLHAGLPTDLGQSHLAQARVYLSSDNQRLYIDGLNLDNLSGLTILSVDGAMLIRQERCSEAGIDVSQLPVGMYLVRITSSEGGAYVVKVLKTR